MGEQLSLDDALDRVEAAADSDWKKRARLAIRAAAFSGRAFTTDDVWEGIGDDVSTRDGRALGPLMREAVAEGLIAPTGNYRTSRREKCHQRPVREWRRIA